MDQVTTHVSSKQIATVFLRKLIAGVDGAAAGGGKVPPRHLA